MTADSSPSTNRHSNRDAENLDLNVIASPTYSSQTPHLHKSIQLRSSNAALRSFALAQ